MLICCLLPIAFTALYTQVVSDVPGEAAGAVSLYLQTLSLAMTAGMVGSMTILYAIAEEKEKHTLRTLMLANVSGAQTLASRALVAFAAILVVDVACFLVMRAPLDALAPYLAFGLLGNVPIVMLSLLLGLAARDQMTAGVYSLPIILAALARMASAFAVFLVMSALCCAAIGVPAGILAPFFAASALAQLPLFTLGTALSLGCRTQMDAMTRCVPLLVIPILPFLAACTVTFASWTTFLPCGGAFDVTVALLTGTPLLDGAGIALGFTVLWNALGIAALVIALRRMAREDARR